MLDIFNIQTSNSFLKKLDPSSAFIFIILKVAIFVKIMQFQEKVIQRGSQILMKFGIYNDISPKDTYLKYFCVQLKVAMENAISKFP